MFGIFETNGTPVNEDRLKAWTIQLVNGDTPDPAPATPREKRVFKSLKKDIKKIKKAGGVVEVPFGLP